MMPTIVPPSTTGSAPIRRSPSLATASLSRASAVIVSTPLPLLRSTAAIVICLSPGTRRCSLDSPTSRGQREAVPQGQPRPDPPPSPRRSTVQRFLRILRLLVLLSVVIAAIAVILVGRGDPTVHVHMLIATGLGVGLTVLLGTGLMALMFLSSESGHDDQAAAQAHKEEGDE